MASTAQCEKIDEWQDDADGLAYVLTGCGQTVLEWEYTMAPQCPHQYDGPADADYNSDRELRYREV